MIAGFPFKHLLLGGCAAILGLCAAAGPALAAPSSLEGAVLTGSACAALAGADISAEAGTPVQILSARIEGSVCRVEGYANPQVSFRLTLPVENWNGKFLEIGNGGMAGSFPDSARAAGTGDPVAAGYAVIVTDGGHRSSGFDAKWADGNLPALIDYSFRAVHVAGLIGKSLVSRAYGRPARLAYFAGCSDGGREALKLAQQFPTDFDGIIAGAPSMRMAHIYLNLWWMSRHVGAARAKGPLSASKLVLLNKAALAQCASVSGISHGNLVHPERCTVDLKPLACAPGVASDTCLSTDELADARAAYDGPRRADGSAVAPASAMPGSELQWAMMAIPAFASYPLDVYRHIAFGPPPARGWKDGELDLDAYPASMNGVETLWSATNPDLRAFRDNGGKLLSYMGLNDPVGGVMDTLDYYRTTRTLMGGQADTNAFYRLFMVPGMAHCSGGAGAYDIDYLAALDRWVDQKQAPARLHGVHPAGEGSPYFEEAIDLSQ